MKLLDAEKLEKWISENTTHSLNICDDVVRVSAVREFIANNRTEIFIDECKEGADTSATTYFKCCHRCNSAVVSFEKKCHKCGFDLEVPAQALNHGDHAINTMVVPMGQIFDKSKYPELSPLPKYQPRRITSNKELLIGGAKLTKEHKKFITGCITETHNEEDRLIDCDTKKGKCLHGASLEKHCDYCALGIPF